MNKKRYGGYIVAGVLVILGIFVGVTYNGLVQKEEAVNKNWASVQSAYQRRLDLTPSLVNIVKGMSDFEKGTLENIARARSNALNGTGGEVSAENYNKQEALQNELAASSNRLIIAIEKYPTLRGTEAYRGLQVQLEGNERRIAVARQDFNGAVQAYNTSVRAFPTSLVASVFGFPAKEGFKAAAGADKNVEIKF